MFCCLERLKDGRMDGQQDCAAEHNARHEATLKRTDPVQRSQSTVTRPLRIFPGITEAGFLRFLLQSRFSFDGLFFWRMKAQILMVLLLVATGEMVSNGLSSTRCWAGVCIGQFWVQLFRRRRSKRIQLIQSGFLYSTWANSQNVLAIFVRCNSKWQSLNHSLSHAVCSSFSEGVTLKYSSWEASSSTREGGLAD